MDQMLFKRSAGKAKTILIVDDEEEIRWSLSCFLQTYGYLTSTAPNGRVALDIIKATEETPDCIFMIITDLSMPVMTGMELIVETKKMDRKIPALVLSGSFEREVMKELKQIGVEGILEKPFRSIDLIEKVNEIIS